jgi:hypothetical protein
MITPTHKKGSIALYRQIEDNFLHPFQEKRKFTKFEAWLDLLQLAYFKDKEKLIQGKLVVIPRGSFDTAAQQLAERWKWDRQTVERFLKLLELQMMISRNKINPKNPKSATLLKINKYNDFQPNFKNESATDATLNATMDATPKNKDNKENNNISSNFDKFWNLYPVKKEKKKALELYSKHLKNGIAEQEIMQGLQNYINHIERNKTEPKYIKHPTTWLNKECWTDEYKIIQQESKCAELEI